MQRIFINLYWRLGIIFVHELWQNDSCSYESVLSFSLHMTFPWKRDLIGHAEKSLKMFLLFGSKLWLIIQTTYSLYLTNFSLACLVLPWKCQMLRIISSFNKNQYPTKYELSEVVQPIPEALLRGLAISYPLIFPMIVHKQGMTTDTFIFQVHPISLLF